MRHRWLCAALALPLLAACGPRPAATPTPAEIRQRLEQACGIHLAELPEVRKSSRVRGAPGKGWSDSVSATIVLPAAEAPAAIEALRRNRTLQRRGESDSRYSYESVPGVLPETSCELDTAQHLLYFSDTR